MEIIENLDHEAFTHYLKKYGNTICGRHPIGVFLGAVQVRIQSFCTVFTQLAITNHYTDGVADLSKRLEFPMYVFLQALRKNGLNGFSMKMKFLNYDQSNQCQNMRDSSVSYASAVFTLGWVECGQATGVAGWTIRNLQSLNSFRVFLKSFDLVSHTWESANCF